VVRTIAMAAAAMLLAMTGACGDDQPAEERTGAAGESTAEPTTEPTLDDGDSDQGGYPPCADVWLDGKKLPEEYDGCDNLDGSIAGSSWQDCTDGSRLYTHDSRFFTLADRRIVDAGGDILDDRGFEKRSRACS
jgi:hypothetical protein